VLYDRTTVNGQTLKHRRLYLSVRKHFFTPMVTKYCHRMPREAVESPSLEIFKNHLHMGLGHLLQVWAKIRRSQKDQMLKSYMLPSVFLTKMNLIKRNTKKI